MIKEQTKFGYVYTGFVKSKTRVAYTAFIVLVLLSYLSFLTVYTCFATYTLDALSAAYVTEMFTLIPETILVVSSTAYKVSNKIGKVLQDISFVDEMILSSTTSTYLSTENILQKEVICTLFVTICLSVYEFFTWYSDYMWLLNYIIIKFVGLILNTSVTQFILLVLLINHRLRSLNSFLTSETTSNLHSNKFIKQKLQQIIGVDHPKILTHKTLSIDICNDNYNPQSNSFINKNEQLEQSQRYYYKQNGAVRMHTLRMLYDVLCDIVSSINGIYGFQILVITMGGVMGMTVSLNAAIIVYSKSGLSHKVTTSFVWATMAMVSLFVVSGCCNSTVKEASRTSVLLQKLLLLQDIHPDMKAEINLFLQQVNIRKVKFTAWDFFTIKYSILGSMIGTVTTYLVIIVQFQKLT
ncbi:hypothetical protein L9F63_024348 [Diploptera punctata]|uniref:Gustatory receptor n=1 Tax=Diploptera punctata TaxID=6984 RepID=A0AAD7ZGZ2_DIPPU|nr:hypothetical protein L9F63_024348 [Diploptera punctata]